jgi:hypothetical protein
MKESICGALSLKSCVEHGSVEHDKRRLCTVLSSARYRMPHGCTNASAAVDATVIGVVISVSLHDRNEEWSQTVEPMRHDVENVYI